MFVAKVNLVKPWFGINNFFFWSIFFNNVCVLHLCIVLLLLNETNVIAYKIIEQAEQWKR